MIKTIIVDDEPLILKNLQLIIPWAALGCEIAGTATNGLDAYELCRQTEADLLLTDISMPGATGLDLLKKLHQLPHKPISILISGYDEFEYAREGIKYGAMDYILKPIDYDELQQCIQKAVSRIRERASYEQDLNRQRLYEALTAGLPTGETRRLKQPLTPLLLHRQAASDDLAVFADMPEQKLQFALSPVQHVVLLDVSPDARKALPARLKIRIHNQKVLIGQPAEREEELKPALQKLAGWMDIRNLFEETVLLLEEAEQKYQSKKSAADGIGTVLRFIEAHFQEDISAEQAADHAGMSVSYFSLVFKQVTGLTFLDYVTAFRIEKACKMLLQTRLKTYEIAEKAGYTDQRYFSQVFKKRMHMTPSEYRKQHAE